jgi:hypothetical protein
LYVRWRTEIWGCRRQNPPFSECDRPADPPAPLQLRHIAGLAGRIQLAAPYEKVTELPTRIDGFYVAPPRREGGVGGTGDRAKAAGRLSTSASTYKRKITMLFAIAVVLILLWLLGLVSSFTMGGLIHVLLIIAIAVMLLRVIGRRRTA